MTERDFAPRPHAAGWHLFVPKLVTVLREGYRLPTLRADLVAGITVAIVALPLAMALAIASGTTPDRGLITVIVAGFLISALGGSRVQIGGPTGAFVVVVFNVIQAHGYDGLILATAMAGLMLVLAGLLRLGTWIKYIPDPVVIGFTAGIAIIIATSQIKDFLGLALDTVPADMADRLAALWSVRDTLSPATLAVAGGTLAAILILRRWRPLWPAFLIAVAAASVAVALFGLEVDTIGSRFGGLPQTLPLPALPEVSLDRLGALLPSAFTIAFLAGVESLLSAVVADGMTGRRHRSNCELVAQGVANMGSALFGGLPATGAIARTATNVRAGGRTPVAGMVHALLVLAFVLLLAPVADYIPLGSLAAVLLVVAWNMSEIDRIRWLLKAPVGECLVLAVTFGLTVFVDLTVAIEVGVVMAAILFMHRMAGVVQVEQGTRLFAEDRDEFADPRATGIDQLAALPPGVEVFELRGPLFFGAAAQLIEAHDRAVPPPRVFIVRMREVPLIDATGAGVFETFLRRCQARGTAVLVTGIAAQPGRILRRMGFGDGKQGLRFMADLGEALAEAERIVATGESPEAGSPSPPIAGKRAR
ncbi:MAG: SulP family inorganic anion transporter [Azospirillaceae bacterium]